MQKTIHTTNSAGIAAGLPDCDSRLHRLSGVSSEWADTVRIYRALKEYRNQHSDFFDSIQAGQPIADFKNVTKRAGVDSSIAIAVIRCLILKSEKETALVTGNSSTAKIKLPVIKGLLKIMADINIHCPLDGLTQRLSEIHEGNKALCWAGELKNWFCSPYGKTIPVGNCTLSYLQACKVIPWLDGYQEVFRVRAQKLAEEQGFSGDVTSMKFKISVKVDLSGKIILSLTYADEEIKADSRQQDNISFARMVIGFAKSANGNNGIHAQKEISKAKSLLPRRKILKVYAKKTGSAAPTKLASAAIIAFFGGVYDLDLFEQPFRLRVIKNTNSKSKPDSVTTVFIQLFELPGAKRASVVLPKEQTWEKGLRYAKFIITSVAARHFVTTGSFTGAKFPIKFLHENLSPAEESLGEAVCVRWQRFQAPDLRFSSSKIEHKNPGQVTLWNRWAEEWSLGKCKAPPVRPRKGKVLTVDNFNYFEIRDLKVPCPAHLRGSEVFIFPVSKKGFGRMLFGMSEYGELAFVIKGVEGRSSSRSVNLRPIELDASLKTIAGSINTNNPHIFSKRFPAVGL